MLTLYTKEIERLCLIGYDEIEKSGQYTSELRLLYVKDKGVNPCCTDTLKSFYREIESFHIKLNPTYKKPIPMSDDRKFRLKKGQMLAYNDGNAIQHATTENLTDDIAVLVLKGKPARINSFETYPSNWKELIGEEAPSEGGEAKKITSKTNKDDLLATAKEMGLPEAEYASLNKADLLEYILSKQS